MTGDGSEDEGDGGSDGSGTDPDGGHPESDHSDGRGDDARPPPSGEHDEPGTAQRYCIECGVQIDADAAFCAECGARQRPSSDAGGSDGEKDRIAAAVLGVFLGGLGVHKFYLGDVGRGILYLCFSWTLLPSLIGLVEGIIYLTKSDAEFQAQYVN